MRPAPSELRSQRLHLTTLVACPRLCGGQAFGWIKTIDGGKLRYLSRARNKLWPDLAAAALPHGADTAYDIDRALQELTLRSVEPTRHP